MTSSFDHLSAPMQVPFESVHIDPNNPRIAEDHDGRYENPGAIFDDALQERMTTRTYEVYSASDLEDSIVAQGWVPIDAIIVWEHSDRPDHYIVVEGNTRTAVLRRIRDVRLPREEAKLLRLKDRSRAPREELREQEQQVVRIRRVIADTEMLTVFPVKAKTPADLEAVLPKLLGVRHVSHARNWGPYATNRYVLSLYERAFYAREGADEPLRLEQDLIRGVAELLSLGVTTARRNIQSASAFDHFKRQYEDQLPPGEAFDDGDHYYFENILQNKYPQDQFGFTKDLLQMSDEAERALFVWAFSKPRPNNDDENRNVLYKAENIRLWRQMAAHDAKNGTSFASQLDVNDPEATTETMHDMEANFLQHKRRQTPLDNLTKLLEALKELRAETMITQANFLKPTLEEIRGVVDRYIHMIDADGRG